MALDPTQQQTDTVLVFSTAKPEPTLQQIVTQQKSKTGHEKYTSALSGRYVSDEMSQIWSDDNKFKLWRVMWATLARAQMELGVSSINLEQVTELEAAIDLEIDYVFAAAKEKELRHDVMAHVKTLAKQCPTAAPIIHLGATSCDITDNAELMQLLQAMNLTYKNGLNVLNSLREFALKNKDVVTLGYTHGQPAQLTTVGKRACMWAEQLQIALINLKIQIDSLKLRGIKGTTGTQATLLALFAGDATKVEELERKVCEQLGFKGTMDAVGQTYHRNVDHFALSAIAGVGASIAKMCEDIRLLASHGEMGEPFEASQIGSSAMAYKQNPMRCERADGLNRVLLALTQQPALTCSVQWLERSLDDSANRRIVLADSFMLTDAILMIGSNIVPGLRVNQGVINRRVREELPFMATEQIILDSVAAGGNRQDIHEAIREHSVYVAKQVKEFGLENNLIALICDDERFPQSVRNTLKGKELNPMDYIGLSSYQVEVFCAKLDAFLQQQSFQKTAAHRAELKV
jgi:adenylosuccinate lyase